MAIPTTIKVYSMEDPPESSFANRFARWSMGFTSLPPIKLLLRPSCQSANLTEETRTISENRVQSCAFYSKFFTVPHAKETRNLYRWPG
jgi:hypothetical protein